MKESKTLAKWTKMNVVVFFLLARPSINSHALGYMENKINAAARFLKMSAHNKGYYDNIWKQ